LSRRSGGFPSSFLFHMHPLTRRGTQGHAGTGSGARKPVIYDAFGEDARRHDPRLFLSFRFFPLSSFFSLIGARSCLFGPPKSSCSTTARLRDPPIANFASSSGQDVSDFAGPTEPQPEKAAAANGESRSFCSITTAFSASASAASRIRLGAEATSFFPTPHAYRDHPRRKHDRHDRY